MLLVADIGNTNIVFGVFHDEKLIRTWRVETAKNLGDDLLKMEKEAFEGGIIGSVVPKKTPEIRKLFSKVLGKDPLILGEAGVNFGIDIKTDFPDRVGHDRLLNAIAGVSLFGLPLLIVDFGTATTFDVVDSDGAYLGGAICPGVHLAIEALSTKTAQLPRVEIKRPEKGLVTGKNTETAIQSGIFYGYLAMIEGMVSRFQKEHGGNLKTITTGGLATLFTAETPALDISAPDLTLQGLRLVYNRNKGQ